MRRSAVANAELARARPTAAEGSEKRASGSCGARSRTTTSHVIVPRLGARTTTARARGRACDTPSRVYTHRTGIRTAVAARSLHGPTGLPTNAVDRILACVDFTSVTPRVVRQAAYLADRLGAELVLLHVAPAEPEWVGYGPGPKPVRDAVARELRDAHEHAQFLAESLRAAGLPHVKALTVQGLAADMILSQADALDPTLIVVGAHYHGPIRELFLGSVARQVLRRTTRPVVVVPERR